MDFIVTFIVEVLFTFILGYPGAFVRWLFLGRKKKIKEVLEENMFINAAIGAISLTFLFMIIIIIKNIIT